MHADPEWYGLKIGDWATWAAAVATVGAVVVALFVSQKAINAERQLRKEEVERAEKARLLQRSILSGICQVELFNLIADCKKASLILWNQSFNTDSGLQAIEMLSVKQLERACERLDLFDLTDGVDLGRVTLITFEMIEKVKRQHAALVELKGERRNEERGFLAQTCVDIIAFANPLYVRFLAHANLTLPTVLPEPYGLSQYNNLIGLRRE